MKEVWLKSQKKKIYSYSISLSKGCQPVFVTNFLFFLNETLRLIEKKDKFIYQKNSTFFSCSFLRINYKWRLCLKSDSFECNLKTFCLDQLKV